MENDPNCRKQHPSWPLMNSTTRRCCPSLSGRRNLTSTNSSASFRGTWRIICQYSIARLQCRYPHKYLEDIFNNKAAHQLRLCISQKGVAYLYSTNSHRRRTPGTLLSHAWSDPNTLTKLCATLERVSVQRQRPSSTSWHAQLCPHCHVSSVSGSVNPLSRWDSWGHSSEDLELPYPSGFYGARHGDQQQDTAHPGAAILEHHGGQHWCWSWTSPSQLQWQKGNVWLRTKSGTM